MKDKANWMKKMTTLLLCAALLLQCGVFAMPSALAAETTLCETCEADPCICEQTEEGGTNELCTCNPCECKDCACETPDDGTDGDGESTPSDDETNDSTDIEIPGEEEDIPAETTPCETETVPNSCPYCEYTLAEDGTMIHSEICNAAYAYDGSADRDKYVQLIPEVAEYGVSVSGDPVNDDGIWFYYDEFGEGTVMKITDWYWDPDTTGLWYCVELYKGAFPEGNEDYQWPATPWILHDYTDYTYEYDAALEFVTVEESCGCCDSCTGDETCTCECVGCTCKGDEPELPSIDAPVTDSEGNELTDSNGNPITVTVSGDALPDGAEVVATVPTVNGELLEGVFDIKVLVDGVEWQPINDGKTVTLSIPVDTDKVCTGVLHIIDCATAIDGDEEIISTKNATAEMVSFLKPAIDAYGDGVNLAMESLSVVQVEKGMAVFETDSFSLYTPEYEIVTDGDHTITFTSSSVADKANGLTFYAPIGQVINFKTEWDEGENWTISTLLGNATETIENKDSGGRWTFWTDEDDFSSCTVTFDASGIEIGDIFQVDWKSDINNKNPRWTRVMIVGEFTTTFRANGGQFSNNSDELTQKIVSYQPVSMIEEPTRLGYVFTGWGTTQDGTGGGTVYTSADSFPATLPTGTIFYAQWEPVQYTVTYVVPDNATNKPLFEAQIKHHGIDLNLLTEIPLVDNNTVFQGWDITGDGYVDISPEQAEAGYTYTEDADLTLVSIWDDEVFSIIFDANGGTGAPEPQYIDTSLVTNQDNWKITIPTQTPVYPGRRFTGWKLDGDSTLYTAGDVKSVSGNLVFRAQWEVIVYAIQFDKTSGSGDNMAKMEGLLYDTSYANLTANTYTKTDYKFQGWSLTQGGVVQYSNGQNVKVSDLVDAAAKAGQTGDTITLYAVWAQKTYKIIYQAANSDSGVSITNLSQIVIYELVGQTTINSSASRNRYTFAGWSDGTNVYQNGEPVPAPADEVDGATITLTATWKMNIVGYICTMVDGSPVMMGTVSAGGYTDPGNPVSYITIQAENGDGIPDMVFTPAKGYEITRIVIEETEYADVSSMLNANGTYTYPGFTATAPHFVAAITSLKSYTITFKDDDDNVLSTQTVQYGSAVTAPADPTKTGYTFEGWVDEDGNAATVPSTMPAEDLVFYAKWESLTYTVTWSSGIGTFPDGTTTKNVTLNYGDTPKWAGDNPIYSTDDNGYTWAGWDREITPVTGNITYTAVYTQWSKITWANWDGSVLETDDQVVTGTKPEYNGATPTREATAQYSYTFSGWSPSVEEATKHVTYTAQYTETVNTYTVTFVDYDGTTVLKTEEVPYGSAATAPADPVRDGYTFTGWDKAFNNVTGDLTVAAQYEKNDVISVTIEWGSLTFVYTEGAWQPGSHTYADGTITPESDTANRITVTNNNESTVAVDVTITYAQATGYTDISGSFDKTTATAAIGGSEQFRLSLSLSGNLTDPPDSFTSGTVTVSIEKTAGGG